eukprot:2915962-Karenia_brevis.AAC.1
MVSADQFLQSDVRIRQAKMKSDSPFGGLLLNVCGDFLQQPPADKDGSCKSVAADSQDVKLNDDKDTDVDVAKREQQKAKLAES